MAASAWAGIRSSDRGASMLEHTALVALVAVLGGAVVASLLTVRSDITTRVSRAVCVIVGGADCGPPLADGERETGQDPSFPDSGPAIGSDGRIVALPFPGAVSVQCSLAWGREDCEGASGADSQNPAVEAVLTESASRSECVLGVATDPRTGQEELRGQVDLGVSTELVIQTKAAGEAHDVTVETSAGVGERTNYQVTVSEDEADAIADGEMAPPNPLDPTTIPQFDSVLLTEENFHQAGMSTQYGALQQSLGFEEGERAASGVTRIGENGQDQDLVEVYVGDEDYVRNRAALGVSYGDYALALGGSREYADVRARTATLDISTQEGWDAYQDFVASGELPEADGPGTISATTISGDTSSSSTEIEARAGPLGISVPARSHDAQYLVEEDSGGSAVETYSYRIDDVTHIIGAQVDPDGNVLERSYHLALNNVDEGLVEGYEQYETDTPPDLDGNQDVLFGFSEQDLLDLQDGILEYAVGQCAEQVVDCAYLGGESDPPETAADMRDRLRSMALDGEPIPAELVGSDLAADVVSYDGADGIMEALGRAGGAGGGSANGVLTQLQGLNLQLGWSGLPRPAAVQPTGC